MRTLLPYTLPLTADLPPGLPVEAHARGQVQVSLTDEEAAALRARGLTLRPAWLASPKAIVTEGYSVLFSAHDWQAAGWSGRGVTVAVLDIGFTGAADLAGEELPGTLPRLGGTVDATAHGAAVAEVVHDIAPEADLLLVQFSTDTEFLAALDLIVDEGADIVVAAIGFDNVWAADGSSVVSAAVTDLVEDEGILWVAAAGNEALRYQHGPLARDPAEPERLRIDGALTDQTTGRSVSLRWDDPSVDLRLELHDADGALCGASDDRQSETGSPTERASADCPPPLTAAVYADASVPAEGVVAYLYASGGWQGAEPTAGTLTLPADAAGAISVGACSLEDGAPGYSSQGPTEDGRLKPDVCAPHGVSTASGGVAGFDGTSSAAPHVAGLLALMLDAGVSPAEARAALSANAVDLGAPGEDTVHGAGLVQAGPAPERRCGCGSASGGGLWAALWALAAATGRYRRRGR